MSILRLNNIVYKSNNEYILKNISLEINKGDCISVIGSSGSGKSTLLKLMADLIPITEGEIYYNGKSYYEYNPLELRREISYCIQLPHLFGETVYDNLIFPFILRKESINKNRIFELLNIFNLEEEILNKNITSLSGGEKQRVSIIRSLIYAPKVLLLDEATSALDKENTENVEKIVKELNKTGITVVWITHNLDQSKEIFNKRIKISEGQIESIEILKCEVKGVM